MYQKGFLSTTLALSSIILFSLVLVTALYLNASGVVTEQLKGSGLKANLAAHSCVEQALNEMREVPSVTGDGALEFTDSVCEYTVTGRGGESRSVVSRGESGSAVAFVEVLVSQITPEIVITSWQETVELEDN